MLEFCKKKVLNSDLQKKGTEKCAANEVSRDYKTMSYTMGFQENFEKPYISCF